MLLGDIVGDDILNDRLESLPPDANAWNDTEIMARLKELGIDTSPQEPAGVLPDGTEPVDAEPTGTDRMSSFGPRASSASERACRKCYPCTPSNL